MLINKQERYTRERYNNAIGTAKTFMSNFWQLNTPITDDEGNEYWNSEGYYMSLRTKDLDIKAEIARLSKDSGNKARKARRMYLLDQDEWRRSEYMRIVIKAKFDTNTDLGKRLLDTPGEIIEKNYWKDDLFGVREDTLQGANILGKCLMEYRDNYINEQTGEVETR